MINRFLPAILPKRQAKNEDLAFVFNGNKLLLKNKAVPKIASIYSKFKYKGLFFGSIGSKNCYTYSVDTEITEDESKIGEFYLVRSLLAELDKAISDAVCYSLHLIFWHNRSKYCGRCGAKTLWTENELAKICTKCKEIFYPKISPAVIVAVTKNNKLLLAQNRNFKDGFFSVLAGFVEIGESIEQTARREIKEEVNIEIDNIKYFYSQAWPFQDSLMIGLVAEYKSGEIIPDGKEILKAGWYRADELPKIPGKETIAGKLIENFKKTNRS